MCTKKLEFEDIKKAKKKLSQYISDTPLEKSIYLGKDKNVFLKLECQQPIKAFKIRGALNKMLSLSEKDKNKGVAAISSGNHGIAVAYVSKMLSMKPATVIVPKNTPDSKIEKIKAYGGNVLLMGNCFDEAYAEGMEYISKNNYTYIDAWDEDVDVYAGQGTVGIEIMKQNPDIDTIILPIGGGGLCTGTALAAKSINPDVKIIGVYSESCPAWGRSVEENKLYHEYPSKESICEAMIGGIGKLSYSMRDLVDISFEVQESVIKQAMAHAVLNEKIVAEAAGAVTIAAFMQYENQIPGKNIALVISGGNANNDILKEVLHS